MKETYFNRITVDPEIMVGKPVFKGTRIPVNIVLDLIGDGISKKRIMEIYPDLTGADLKAAIKNESYSSWRNFLKKVRSR